MRGKGIVTLLVAPFSLAHLFQALGVMRRIGRTGSRLRWVRRGSGRRRGVLMRAPLVITSNAIAGYSNGCLAHLARRVLAALPAAFPGGIDARGGNPVRAEIVAQPLLATASPAR